MTLSRLQINNIRNLQGVRLDALEKINVFHGVNGSGKTSVLEAIHLLGMARSFRGSSARTLIRYEQELCTVYGQSASSGQALGVQRQRTGESQIRIAGETVRSVAELVEQLPLQLINASSFELLMGAPAARRQFMNWGVFHVEHRFYPEWQRFQRCIKQRNMLLRRGKMSPTELSVWTRDLADSGTRIHEFREAYLGELIPRFQQCMQVLAPGLTDALELKYRPGWESTLPYAQALDKGLESDQEQGFTHAGPQRADIRITHEGYSAAETLSRGQQKLLVCGLKLAQGQLMSDLGQAGCTYLVDDLPSELDQAHCRNVCQLLSAMQSQVFITCVDKGDLDSMWPTGINPALFHVEHGCISREPAM